MGLGAASGCGAGAERCSIRDWDEELVESFGLGTRDSTMGSGVFRGRMDGVVHRAGVAASSVGTGVVLGAHDAARAVDAGRGAADRAGPADDCVSAGAAGGLGEISCAAFQRNVVA